MQGIPQNTPPSRTNKRANLYNKKTSDVVFSSPVRESHLATVRTVRQPRMAVRAPPAPPRPISYKPATDLMSSRLTVRGRSGASGCGEVVATGSPAPVRRSRGGAGGEGVAACEGAGGGHHAGHRGVRYLQAAVEVQRQGMYVRVCVARRGPRAENRENFSRGWHVSCRELQVCCVLAPVYSCLHACKRVEASDLLDGCSFASVGHQNTILVCSGLLSRS